MKPEAIPRFDVGVFEKRQKQLRDAFPRVFRATESVLKIAAYSGSACIAEGSAVVIEGKRVITASHVVEHADALLLCTHVAAVRLTSLFDGDILIDEDLEVATFLLPEVFDGVVRPQNIMPSSIKDPKLFLLGFPLMSEEIAFLQSGRGPIIQPSVLYTKDGYDLFTMFVEQNERDMRGSSGGPLVNEAGEVVAVVNSGYQFVNARGTVTHVIYATDLEEALRILA